jgi:polynucleotide 5'-kinase involved in rRNA processing
MTSAEGAPQKKRVHDDGKHKKHKMSDQRNYRAPINPDSVVALEATKPARHRERMVKGGSIPKHVERKAKMAHSDRRSYRTKTHIEFSHAEHVLTDEAESFQVSGKTKQGVVARRNLRG